MPYPGTPGGTHGAAPNGTGGAGTGGHPYGPSGAPPYNGSGNGNAGYGGHNGYGGHDGYAGHDGHGHGGYGGHDGYWAHTWHGGNYGWWWVAGPAWYLWSYPYAGYYGSPGYYTSYDYTEVPDASNPGGSTAVDTSVPQDIDASDVVPGAWYWCEDAQAYFPYVRTCAAGWVVVSPQEQR